MKYILILFTLIFISCDNKKPIVTGYSDIDTTRLITMPKKTPENYDSECVVGRKYDICSPFDDKNNQFENEHIHTVIILQKIKGYVQYCEYYDYKKPDKITFNRTCEQFIYSVNLCK